MDFVPTDKFKVTTAPWPAGQPVPTIAGPKPGQPGVPLAYTEFVTFHEKGLDFDYVVAGRTDGAISRWKVQQVAAGRRRLTSHRRRRPARAVPVAAAERSTTS